MLDDSGDTSLADEEPMAAPSYCLKPAEPPQPLPFSYPDPAIRANCTGWRHDGGPEAVQRERVANDMANIWQLSKQGMHSSGSRQGWVANEGLQHGSDRRTLLHKST